MTSPAGTVVTQLRRIAPWLAAAALVGGAVGGVGAALAPLRWASTATLLVSARSLDPEGFRRRPLSLDELRTHLDPSLLGRAAIAAGLEQGALAGAVELSARSQSGLYDVTVALADAAAAKRAGDAVVAELVTHLRALRERRVTGQLTGLEAGGEAKAAREAAEEALFAELGSGALERAEREAAPVELAKVRERRARLEATAERARERERIEREVQLRGRAAAYAFEPWPEPFTPAGEAVRRERNLARAGGGGAAAGTIFALALLLLLGGLPPRNEP